MQCTVRVSPVTLPEASYRFKVGEARAWSQRQFRGRYLGEAARWVESPPSRRSKKGAYG
jgi:hypothetical protein